MYDVSGGDSVVFDYRTYVYGSFLFLIKSVDRFEYEIMIGSCCCCPCCDVVSVVVSALLISMPDVVFYSAQETLVVGALFQRPRTGFGGPCVNRMEACM